MSDPLAEVIAALKAEQGQLFKILEALPPHSHEFSLVEGALSGLIDTIDALAEADEGKSCATDSERCGACCSAYVCPDGKRANRYCPQCRTQPSWNNPSLAERREERQQEDDYWGRRRRLY
jgi:hypothetical protein